MDLAYAAVFFNEEKLAREVERLEDRQRGSLRRLRTMAMLAARSPEDAEEMAGVLWIADAIEKTATRPRTSRGSVGGAPGGIPDQLRPDLRHADEMTARVKIRAGSQTTGQTLRELSLPTETGMWVMATKSGMDWRFDPGPDDVVSEGDVLLIRGPEEGVNLVRALAGAPELPEVSEGDAPPCCPELDRAVDIRSELKDLAEAAVGLAYSSLLFNNRALAAEVGALGGPRRHPAGRARVVGAPRRPRGSHIVDEAPGPSSLCSRRRERQIDLRRGSRHDLVRGARRATAPGRP